MSSSARREAERLQGGAEKALAEAEALKLQARLEDLTEWTMENVKQSRKRCKMDGEAARERKAEGLRMRG